MTLLETYKKDVKRVLNRIYGNGISEAKLDKYIDNIISKRKYEPVINMRNIYKMIDNFEEDADQILNVVENNELNILSNGAYSENYKNVKAPTTEILVEWGKERDKYKEIQFQKMTQGDLVGSRDAFMKQNRSKIYQNTMYGISLMSGAYMSNVDVGSAITAQARNFISETMWSTERLIADNTVFENVGEMLQYITKVCERPIPQEALRYIDYIPSKAECRARLIKISKDLPYMLVNGNDISTSLFVMIESMTDIDRILFYYTNNLVDTVVLNPKIFGILDKIMNSRSEFDNVYEIPDDIVPHMDQLVAIIKAIVINPIMTYQRVDKYLTKKRKTTLLSDTDSIINTLSKIVMQLAMRYKSEHKIMPDEVMLKRLENTVVNIIDVMLQAVCTEFGRACGAKDDEFKDRLKMKNELYIARMIVFETAKKNYVGLNTYIEGRPVTLQKQLITVGRSFISRTANPEVKSMMLDIIEHDILRASHVDIKKILSKIEDIKVYITKELKKGNHKLGILQRFNGTIGIKDPEVTTNARTSLIWNRLYPEDEILPGDNIYTFNTSLETEEDLSRIPDKFSEIRERIRFMIFDATNTRNNYVGEDFRRFGLRMFAVPAEGDLTALPEWIVPFIEIDDMITKHIQPIVALLPSIGLSPAKNVNRKAVASYLVKM